MSLIDRTFEEALAGNTLIGIHTDSSTSFILGWITQYNADAYLLLSVDEYGLPDSSLWGSRDHIHELILGSPYIEAMENTARSSLSFVGHPVIDLPIKQDELLEYLKTNGAVCSFMDIDRDTTIAVVQDFDDEWILLQEYDKSAMSQGRAVARKDDIVYIEIGGKALRRIASLLATKI